MRFLREVSIRFVGDKELGQRYIPLGRKVLGELVNRDGELGGLEQSLSRKRYDSGLYIEAGYIGDIPFITIDVTSLDKREETKSAVVYAVFPQGELGGTFPVTDIGTLPVAPSPRNVGLIPREDGALVKLSYEALNGIFAYGGPTSRTLRRADIVWTSVTGASLYCQVEPEVDKYNLVMSLTSAGLGNRANPTAIYYRGNVLLSLASAHSGAFEDGNNICGMGVYDATLLYMTRPNIGEPSPGTISVWAHALTAPGIVPGVRPALSAGGPVLVDTFAEGTQGYYSVWYNFSGTGRKCVRVRTERTIVNTGTAPNITTTDTIHAAKEELIFSRDEFGVFSFLRTVGAQGSSGAIASVSTITETSTSNITYPNGQLAELFPSAVQPVIYLINWDDLDSETLDTSATGRQTIAFDYADDEEETLISLDWNIVSSTATGTWSDKYDRAFTREYWSDGDPPFDVGDMNFQTTSDIVDHIYSYTQTISIQTQLIYSAQGFEYVLPYTDMANTYTATQTTNVTDLWPVGGSSSQTTSDVDSASGSVDMDGQQNFLDTANGAFVAMNLKHGIFVESSIISTETYTKADDANPVSNLSIARVDNVYRCAGGVTEKYLLPEIEGVGTAGRPVYSLTDNGYDLGVTFKPNDGFFERGMICRTVRGTSGLGRDVSVNPDWALAGGVGRYGSFGFGGTLAVAPGDSCLVSIESYSVEDGGAGWTPYAVLPVCKQAAFTLHFAAEWEGPKVQAVCEKMWRSHEYGTFTSTPTEVAVIGTVEWAGFVTYTD